MDYNSDNNNSNNSQNNEFNFNFNCDDILGGFQELSPELFVIIGEILANVISGKIPFNVQNAIGNWLQLVGQIIETYNAQQQYFQGGPGRYFNPAFYNVSNPFCQDNGTATESSSSSGRYSEMGMNTDNYSDYKVNIRQLRVQLDNIEKQIKKMEEEMKNT